MLTAGSNTPVSAKVHVRESTPPLKEEIESVGTFRVDFSYCCGLLSILPYPPRCQKVHLSTNSTRKITEK